MRHSITCKQHASKIPIVREYILCMESLKERGSAETDKANGVRIGCAHSTSSDALKHTQYLSWITRAESVPLNIEENCGIRKQ
jgi:hypothetical protein